MATPPPSIAIVGMGPRGISLVERLAAHLNQDGNQQPLTLHLIDDAQHGAGRIWDTAQTHTLCMNTLAGAVTLFTEPGSTVGAPPVEGPTLFEWIKLVRGERSGLPAAKLRLFDAHEVRESDLDPAFAEELAATREESNPSRALYGIYLRWVFTVALDLLPESVRIINHYARVTAIRDAGDHDVLELSDASRVEASATVLAYGWQVPAAGAEEERLAAATGAGSGLHWVRPDNPVEQPLGDLPAGQAVLTRGMGMGFFDVMALTSLGRGGRFVEDPAARSGLRYVPSGTEPHLVVASGRGYPYLPKSEYHALPPRAPLPRFGAALESTAGKSSLDFAADLLPAILRDAYAEYYTVQERTDPDALRVPLAEILERIDATFVTGTSLAAACGQLTTALDGVSSTPLDLAYWANPLADTAQTHVSGMDAAELTAYIAGGLARDITEATRAANSPLKCALWVISSARKPSSIAASNGRLDWDSRTTAYKEFMAFGQMVGSGPPLFRTRQLLALVDAGLITFLGPRPQLTWADAADSSDAAFTLTSAGRQATSAWLVDAWMHQPDVRRIADPMSDSIAQRSRPFVDGGHTTGSPETTVDRRTVHPDGTVDPRLHIVGIPTYAQWPDTTISPMPGTDPLMLQETDRTAASLAQAAFN